MKCASQNPMEPPAPGKRGIEGLARQLTGNGHADDNSCVAIHQTCNREKLGAFCARTGCLHFTVDHKVNGRKIPSGANTASHESEGGRSVPVRES
jgi:hypothetical protein